MDIKKIVIATGIYPPQIGGPAEYAKNLEDTWRAKGYSVTVKYFSFENRLPTGFRHIVFLLKSLPSLFKAEYILVLDTFSVALPVALGCFLLGKKFVVRTGGDFLWESYVERTKEKILFRGFYKNPKFNLKESVIFKLTKWILGQASCVVFSTQWQRDVWKTPYNINEQKIVIVENFYGEHSAVSVEFGTSRAFVGGTRNLVWKNIEMLKEIFDEKTIVSKGIVLDSALCTHNEFISKIEHSLGVILISLGDISPNMILDAIQCNKPFICTRETGLFDRLKDVGIFVDPLNKSEIVEKILWLCDANNYRIQVEKVANFNFTHTWEQIASELLNLKQ